MHCIEASAERKGYERMSVAIEEEAADDAAPDAVAYIYACNLQSARQSEQECAGRRSWFT